MPPRFDLVPEHSTVIIDARSSIHPIRVEAAATGWIEPVIEGESLVAGPASGLIEIPVADLRSGNPLIDRETRRRVDARSHPLIRAELTGISGVKGSTATVEGDVEFLGQRVTLQGDAEFRLQEPGLTLTGAATFDVRWWGLEPPKLLLLRVDSEVAVSIDLVFTPA